ncbi:uncharacterized protein BX664DRAFT_366861 [Halteromyces radiatus]|uniref:uncharacterized protein n=1 Tax=Halteromyces radiatus TaxID=101107 RepID=UPI00221FBC7A|nr:uncharacterized protein BX664DRAFT_366861 [Halteromyces radiatus]KAI8081570.1 hypothetical protein BX664DRAFT_366861 [Halteromyces radiatus]
MAALAGAGLEYMIIHPSTVKDSNKLDKKKPSQTTIQQAFHRLQQVLPPEHVTVDEEILQNHGYSSNSYHNEGSPNIVVFPRNTEEVVELVKIANEFSIPIIPFSGGTSLEGHFAAPLGGISISFREHMDDIIALHLEDMDVVVKPGVGFEDLNKVLREYGLFFPVDPGPGACIGGMVGTSCSGTNAVRYGTMKEWVINLTVVTADGKVIKTRQRPRKSSAGYDLTRLFIGSEGTLGIVTEITLKLAVLPEKEAVAVCNFPTIRDAADVVPELVRAGVQINAVELLDDEMMRAVMMSSPQLGHAIKPTLFFKFSGSQAQIDHEIKVVSEITRQHKGGPFKYAKDESERKELWEARKICLWSASLLKQNASVWTTDVVVPLSRLPDIIDETKKDLKESMIEGAIVGHVGDGNFHAFLLFDETKPEEYEEAKRLNKKLLERAIGMEGSVSGEHGCGIGKKGYLRSELGDTTVDMMATIKYALDPKGIMNPGKVLPDD